MNDAATQTPFDIIGGAEVIGTIVDHFYNLMDSEGEYKALRSLHAPELNPMRKSLTEFLISWMGGPRTWFENRPGACIVSTHANIAIDKSVSDQWVHAMNRAIAYVDLDETFANAMMEALGQMAAGMQNR